MITRIFGAVTGGRLNLRASADSSASILSSIPNENLLVITFIRLPVQPAGRRHWLTECLCFCLILLFSRSRVIMHGESGLKYPFRDSFPTKGGAFDGKTGTLRPLLVRQRKSI